MKGRISASRHTTMRCRYCRTPACSWLRCQGVSRAMPNRRNSSVKAGTQPHCFIVWVPENPLLARLQQPRVQSSLAWQQDRRLQYVLSRTLCWLDCNSQEYKVHWPGSKTEDFNMFIQEPFAGSTATAKSTKLTGLAARQKTSICSFKNPLLARLQQPRVQSSLAWQQDRRAEYVYP